jgi:hypothetical protein
VLVKDYNEGKHVIFDRRATNVKEAFTSDGTKMCVALSSMVFNENGES